MAFVFALNIQKIFNANKNKISSNSSIPYAMSCGLVENSQKNKEEVTAW
jgi:hypothetical protein